MTEQDVLNRVDAMIEKHTDPPCARCGHSGKTAGEKQFIQDNNVCYDCDELS